MKRASGTVGVPPPAGRRRAWRGPPGALVLGGIGDFLVVEARLTRDERDRVQAAYYGAPAAAEHEALLRAVPAAFPNLRRHTALPGRRAFYSKAHCERAVGRLPAGVDDWSIGWLFPKKRAYGGSTFLAHRLADAPPVPGPYVVVVPHSTWGRWHGRNFDAGDWAVCLEFLERHELYGVVLCRERLPVPEHARLLDWQGRTSILESVELLKQAEGYAGIDSWMSCLAAMHFPAGRLAIKAFNPFLLEWAGQYYGPHTTFPFVKPTLEAPTWGLT